jgi:hypothetical protein
MAFKAVPLHDTGKAFALGCTCYVNEISGPYRTGGYGLSGRESFGIVNAYLSYETLGCGAGFFKAAHLGLVGSFGFFLIEPELDGIVTIVFPGFDLEYYTGTCLDECDGNCVAAAIEDLGHAQLLT